MMLPSPLWGGVRGGGAEFEFVSIVLDTPLPTLPHKGGGTTLSSPIGLTQTEQKMR